MGVARGHALSRRGVRIDLDARRNDCGILRDGRLLERGELERRRRQLGEEGDRLAAGSEGLRDGDDVRDRKGENADESQRERNAPPPERQKNESVSRYAVRS
jgi:hypothetical protein